MSTLLTIDEFIAEYEGKTVGYPHGSYVGECLSLAKWYLKDVLGIGAPPPSGSNAAHGYWYNFPDPLGDYLVKIPNTPDLVFQKGDVPVWSAKVGAGYGHIDVVIGEQNTLTTFLGLDQNWNGRHAHRVQHNYDNILGVLRPKHLPQPPAPQPDPEPTPPTDDEMLPWTSVFSDLQVVMTDERPTPDEIEWRRTSGKNLVEIGNDIGNGDSRFYKKWVKPRVDEAVAAAQKPDCQPLLDAKDREIEGIMYSNSKLADQNNQLLTELGLVNDENAKLTSDLKQAQDAVQACSQCDKLGTPNQSNWFISLLNKILNG